MVAGTVGEITTVGAGGDYIVPPGSILNQVNIEGWRQEGRDGVFTAMVPIDLIAPDVVPVFASRVAEMQDLLLSARQEAGGVGTGVLDSLLLGEVPGERTLRIADGFHRLAAVAGLNADPEGDYDQSEAYCFIVPNCTEEKVMDLRIASASEHGEVSFARASLWILDFWPTTPWSEKITASQAFGIAALDSSGEGYGLTASEAEEVKAWAKAKSKLWHVKPGTLRDELALASIAPPDLVSAVRPRIGAHRLQAITRDHLDVIANAFSHTPTDAESGTRQNWDIQRLLAGYVLEHNLAASKVRVLVGMLKGSRTVADVGAKLTGIKPSQLTATHKGTGRPIASRDSAGLVAEIHELRTGDVAREVVIALQGLEIAIYKGRFAAGRLDVGNTQLFTVDPGDDARIAKALTLRENPGLEDKLSDRVGRIARLIADRNEAITVSDADAVASTAINRIVQSTLDGPLQYILFSGQLMIDNALHRAMLDELKLRNLPEDTDSELSEFDEILLGGEVLGIDLEQVVGAYPTLSSTDKMLIARHGILQLDDLAISAITRTDDMTRVHRAMLATRSSVKRAGGKVLAVL